MILKAIFPIDRLDQLEKVLSKITNLAAHAQVEEKGLCMEVVFMGEAIYALKNDSAYLPLQRALEGQGVSLAACKNAMARYALTGEDLIPAARQVTSGVGQTIQRQIEGWGAYWC